MKAEIALFYVVLVFIAITLSACIPQEIAELDEHTKSVLITYTTPQAEPLQMIETFTNAEKTEIINPYFSIKNSTAEIFRVDHAGDFYLYPFASSGKLYTDAAGKLMNGTDADTDTNLTEDNVEAYIFDEDNTANLNMTDYNITFNGYALWEHDDHLEVINSSGGDTIFTVSSDSGESHIHLGVAGTDYHVLDQHATHLDILQNSGVNIDAWFFHLGDGTDALIVNGLLDMYDNQIYNVSYVNATNINVTNINATNIQVEENVTVENIILEGNTTFKMYANETCWVINVASTYFEVCS